MKKLLLFLFVVSTMITSSVYAMKPNYDRFVARLSCLSDDVDVSSDHHSCMGALAVGTGVLGYVISGYTQNFLAGILSAALGLSSVFMLYDAYRSKQFANRLREAITQFKIESNGAKEGSKN